MPELIPHLDGRSEGPELNASPASQTEPQVDLKVALNRVTHDINNPLAIISGNAQLLLELARALELDPDVAKPIQDIEEASQRLASMVERLNALNEATRQNFIGGDGA